MADEKYVELTSAQFGALVNGVIDASVDTNSGINVAATFSSGRSSAQIDKNGQGEIRAGYFIFGVKVWDKSEPLKFKIDINKLGLGVGTEFLGAQITFTEADENGIMLAEAKVQFAGFSFGGTGSINLAKIDASFTEWLHEIFGNPDRPIGRYNLKATERRLKKIEESL